RFDFAIQVAKLCEEAAATAELFVELYERVFELSRVFPLLPFENMVEDVETILVARFCDGKITAARFPDTRERRGGLGERQRHRHGFGFGDGEVFQVLVGETGEDARELAGEAGECVPGAEEREIR